MDEWSILVYGGLFIIFGLPLVFALFGLVYCWVCDKFAIDPDPHTANLVYDSKSQTVTLFGRCDANFRALKIVADRDIQTKYEPKRLVYTSATVGGITTGGFHEAGGYTYVSSNKKTGKYNLYYRDELLPIKKIKLSDELFEQAKQSEIKNFLNQNKEIVVIEECNYSAITLGAIELGHPKAEDLAMEDMRKGFPSREKCEKILQWVCGKTPQE